MEKIEPCEHLGTCKECLQHYEEIYPDIQLIATDGARVKLKAGLLMSEEKECTIKIINDAVIITDGKEEEYLCNVITDDDEDYKSVELLEG